MQPIAMCLATSRESTGTDFISKAMYVFGDILHFFSVLEWRLAQGRLSLGILQSGNVQQEHHTITRHFVSSCGSPAACTSFSSSACLSSIVKTLDMETETPRRTGLDRGLLQGVCDSSAEGFGDAGWNAIRRPWHSQYK
mmetsp:Transcript_80119/g.146147  ORF Transcript_80119/g.146147 Transcript_80119/m.146147 type:complete len:139 (-) Transcript_80119:62-478(-)